MGSFRLLVWAGLTGLLATSAASVMATPATESRLNLAAIPLIRDAPVDLQGALANDFVVAQQTPFSSGRNEILSVSPSTGTEQLYEVSLPETGEFQLYESAFSNVDVSEPGKIAQDASSLSEAQIVANVAEFSIRYDDNRPAIATLADGTTATFEPGQIVVRSPSGQTIETIAIQATLPSATFHAAKSLGSRPVQIAQADNSDRCQQTIRDRFYEMSVAVSTGAKTLEEATSDYGKIFNWVLTFGAKALENSTVPNSRNLTFQSVACQSPVVCNEPQTYEGASEIRTDLFRLPKGANQLVTLEHEFYTIPDRMELYYDGEMIFEVGPASGYDVVQIDSLPDDAAYVGVKIIGNTDANTLWWYTIRCESELPQ